MSSVRLVVDEDGDVVASYDADEFGNPTVVSESGGSTDQRWVGGLGYKDETAATGLYYLRQRYYDPGIGRFISRDPIGGLNLYAYCSSNPLNFVDPSGLYYEYTLNGDDVSLRIPIELVWQGSTATGMEGRARQAGYSVWAALAIKREAEGFWNRKVGRYNVSCEVKFVGPETPEDRKNTLSLRRGDDRSRSRQKPLPGLPDQPSVGYEGIWYDKYLDNSKFSPAIHELGHFMGLEDGYYDTPPFSLKPGYEVGNVMARGPYTSVEEWQLDKIVDAPGWQAKEAGWIASQCVRRNL